MFRYAQITDSHASRIRRTITQPRAIPPLPQPKATSVTPAARKSA